MAQEVGVIQNGEIPALKTMAAPNQGSSNNNNNNQYKRPANSGPSNPNLAKRAKVQYEMDTATKMAGDLNAIADVNSQNNLKLALAYQKSSALAAAASSSSTQIPKVKKVGAPEKSRGLRHSSMRVMKKVEAKGRTTYNEVADELVYEYTHEKNLTATEQAYEGKNIRRRVYDILNVLIAMDIIQKDKKQIIWKGLPASASHDINHLQRERIALLNNIEEKRMHVQELLLQQIALRNLVKRNEKLKAQIPDEQKVPLPFIVINTNKDTVIECEMAENVCIFLYFPPPFYTTNPH